MTMPLPESTPAGPRPAAANVDPADESAAPQQGCFWRRPCLLPPCNPSNSNKARSFMALREEDQQALEPVLYASEESAASSISTSNEQQQPQQEQREEALVVRDEEQQPNKQCVLFPAALIKRIRTGQTEDSTTLGSSQQQPASPPRKKAAAGGVQKQSKQEESTINSLKTSPKSEEKSIVGNETPLYVLPTPPEEEPMPELQPEELQQILTLTKSKSSHSSSFRSMEGVEVSKVSSGSFSISLSAKDLPKSSSLSSGLSLSDTASGGEPKPLWKRRLSFSRKVNSTDAVRPIPRSNLYTSELSESPLLHPQPPQPDEPDPQPKEPERQQSSQQQTAEPPPKEAQSLEDEPAESQPPVKISFRDRSSKRRSTKEKVKKKKSNKKLEAENDKKDDDHKQSGGKPNKKDYDKKRDRDVKIRHVYIPRGGEWDETSALSIVTPASSVGTGGGGIAANEDDEEGTSGGLSAPQSWEWMEQWLLMGQCNYYYPTVANPAPCNPAPPDGDDDNIAEVVGSGSVLGDARASRSTPMLFAESQSVRRVAALRDSVYMLNACGADGKEGGQMTQA